MIKYRLEMFVIASSDVFGWVFFGFVLVGFFVFFGLVVGFFVLFFLRKRYLSVQEFSLGVG